MVWYGTSHSTHFRSFWRLGVTGISQVRFVAAVSAEARPTAQPHSVSGGEKWEWPTITVAGMCVIERPCVRWCLAKMWVSLEHYLCVSKQPSWATLKYRTPGQVGEHERTTAWRSCAQEAADLLPLQPASITSSGTFQHECNGLSYFWRDTAVSLCTCPRI